MPRFYFDSGCGDAQVKDERGTDYPSQEEAETEMSRALRSLVGDNLSIDGPDRFVISLRDSSGQKVSQVSLTLSVFRRC